MPRVGFVGLGIMGVGMAGNLKKKGHDLVVWNRTREKCLAFEKDGAKVAETPADVVNECDIVFACLADPEIAMDVVFRDDGILKAMKPGKAYVDCSTVDEECSNKIGDAITAAGGRFLEAPVSGSKKPAEDGTLIFLTAGDESLYKDSQPYLEAMGKKHLYLGKTGAGARMKLVVNMVQLCDQDRVLANCSRKIMGSMMNAFAEGMTLAESSDLDLTALLEVLDAGAMSNPMFRLKGPSMAKGEYPPAFPLKHQQKDMRLALALGDKLEVSMPVAAAANESFKRARMEGKGDLDFSAVHGSLRKPK